MLNLRMKAASDTAMEMPQILYIMGTGRSGTTVLEILLSNNSQISGIGEATHIFRDGFIDNVDCSCGQPAGACSLWSEVAKRCNWGRSNIQSLAQLFHDVAWHSRFPILAAGLMPGDVLSRYRSVNACLFSVVSALTGASLIVDSSKFAGRALALAKIFPGLVRVICITRSPAGLVASFEKTDAGEQLPKSLPAIFFYYIYSLACFRVVAWRLGPRLMKVVYEDILASPVEALERIGSWSNQDLSHAICTLRDEGFLEVGHVVTGNRLRKQGKIKFKRQMPINNQAGFLKKIVIWVMNLYRRALGF